MGIDGPIVHPLCLLNGTELRQWSSALDDVDWWRVNLGANDDLGAVVDKLPSDDVPDDQRSKLRSDLMALPSPVSAAFLGAVRAVIQGDGGISVVPQIDVEPFTSVSLVGDVTHVALGFRCTTPQH
jgi:hypothetical protein